MALHQLAEELIEVVGPDLSFSADGDAMQATPERPVRVWVDGATDPTRGVLEAVRAHEPDPDWRPRRAVPPHLSIDAIRAKAARREMLTPDELQAAVRHLLG